MQLTIGGKNVVVTNYQQLLWFMKSGSTEDSSKKPAESGTPPAPIAVVDPPPPLYALIIGINRYRAVNQLRGCVPDANDMDTYLRESLKVPPSQIRNLRDADASRVAIISAFKDLANDERIKSGDPIVIFYAGHGGETAAPPGWETEDGKTQYLLPMDISTKDPQGNLIRGIPDRTVAVLLDRLAKAKGDNISVIFDCCHSGSGTRTGDNDPGRIARVVKLDDDVPSDLDREIYASAGSRGSSIPPAFAHTGLASHVLLAACSSKELALEENGRGVFTKTLLETLRATGADKVSYKDVLSRIKALPSQNPQCEGINQDRILFNSKVPGIGRVFYELKLEKGAYTIDGGAANGITEGAEFTIYKEKESPIVTPPIGKLVTQEIKAFSTILSLPEGAEPITFTNVAYALQTRAGIKDDLRVYVPLKDELNVVYEAVKSIVESDTNIRRIQLVERDKAPQIGVDIDNGRIVFDTFDSQSNGYGLTRLPASVENTVDAVSSVIRGAANFYWHLDIANAKQPLNGKVEVEVYQVEQKEDEVDDDFNPIITPVSDNLNVAGAVYLDDDESKIYGVKIVNNTPLSLYPSLFYFDQSHLEIQSVFKPGSGGKQFKVDAPLQPKSSLTIGYGGSGYKPRDFSLPDGLSTDVGFFKLFLTTEYVDYSYIPQTSPFGESRGSGEAKIRTPQIWDAMKIPIIQRKAA